jgi:CheY-like chemotaxis protein
MHSGRLHSKPSGYLRHIQELPIVMRCLSHRRTAHRRLADHTTNPQRLQYNASGCISFHRFALQWCGATGRAFWAPGMLEDTAMERESTIEHLLVIDDDQSNLELYREIFEEEGFRVSVSTSPLFPPQDISDLNPDLILLDLRFGESTGGLDFLSRLKANLVTLSVPVLVCSADHQQLAAIHAQLVAWGCGILAKPFDLDELLAVVRSFLASADVLSAAVAPEVSVEH